MLCRVTALGSVALLAAAGSASAQEGVASTVHNLSVSGPGEIRAVSETEICKFCHIPHTPVARRSLWGHELSQVRNYRVPELRPARGVAVPAPQPDGSSRLCLSCHDGTVALGDIGQTGDSREMAGAQRLGPGRRGHLGTDLSGSHPVSIPIPDTSLTSSGDMGFRASAGGASESQRLLDPQGKVQCTSCHDPHSDRYYQPGRVPHFWVRPSLDEVCLACHELR